MCPVISTMCPKAKEPRSLAFNRSTSFSLKHNGFFHFCWHWAGTQAAARGVVEAWVPVPARLRTGCVACVFIPAVVNCAITKASSAKASHAKAHASVVPRGPLCSHHKQTTWTLLGQRTNVFLHSPPSCWPCSSYLWPNQGPTPKHARPLKPGLI